jgi:hypothetical protein
MSVRGLAGLALLSAMRRPAGKPAGALAHMGGGRIFR